MLSFFFDAVTTLGVVGEDRTAVVDEQATGVIVDEMAGFGGLETAQEFSSLKDHEPIASCVS